MTILESRPVQHSADEIITMTVAHREVGAEDVVVLTLSGGGVLLPEWEAGAHIDLVVGDGTTRQFSLCGDPLRRDVYEVAVLRAPDGRGGSQYVHDAMIEGSTVQVKGPRNHFRFDDADRYIFVAGGIGITPMLPMIADAERRGATWKLIYVGRSQSSMAFLERLAPFGDKVVIWPKDERGQASIRDLVGPTSPDTLVYSCGPERLMNELEALVPEWDGAGLRLERFAAGELAEPVRADGFEVHLSASDVTFTVPPDKSVLEAIEEHGVDIESSCGDGTCGTCEVPVLEGEPDHRDSVLTDEEQACNDCMMVCVSRAKSNRLVLDL